jgi:hypothetical protein
MLYYAAAMNCGGQKMALPFWRKRKRLPQRPTWGATQKEAATASQLQDACGLKSWLEIPQRNSESRLQLCDSTINIQNLTFQSPLKLAVKPIVSLVRPTNSLFVSFASKAADYAAVANDK